MTPTCPWANEDAPKSPTRASEISEADLAERCHMVEVALASPSLLPDWRASLLAALARFQSTEARVMETLVCLAKLMEVCCLYFLPCFSPLHVA